VIIIDINIINELLFVFIYIYKRKDNNNIIYNYIMTIKLTLRDGIIIIPKDYYSKYLSFDWFFSKMIENEKDNNGDEYTLWEEKNAILSIFDSLKFSKLIIHRDVSLEYLSSLCEMWLVPVWIKDALKDRQEFQDRKNDDYESKINKIYECKNCNVGFKLYENKNDSCKFHKGILLRDNNQKRYSCCGSVFSAKESQCIIGYHII
jgi:hypothetical protein